MRYIKLIFVLPLLLLFAACGGSEKQSPQTKADNSQAQPQAQAPTNNEVRTIHIYGINQMKFVVKEGGEQIGTGETIKATNGNSYLLLESITAKPGEKLHIMLTNVTKMPAMAMSHDWVLLKQGTDVDAYAAAALKAKANDYIPKDFVDSIIAHTEMAAGGKTVEVTFTVPDKTGDFDYLCSFPAHYLAGMKGKLIVK